MNILKKISSLRLKKICQVSNAFFFKKNFSKTLRFSFEYYCFAITFSNVSPQGKPLKAVNNLLITLWILQVEDFADNDKKCRKKHLLDYQQVTIFRHCFFRRQKFSEGCFWAQKKQYRLESQWFMARTRIKVDFSQKLFTFNNLYSARYILVRKLLITFLYR